MGKYVDIKEIAKMVRKQLKKEFPQCKFSVRIERYSGGQSMTVSLMEAPFAATTNGEDYLQLNHYKLRSENYDDRFNDGVVTEKAWSAMRRAVELMNEHNWDNSDAMIDYFDVNFYMSVHIGKWDKPFQQTAQEEVAADEPVITQERDWTWIKFSSKPAVEVREVLKALGARWSGKRQAWYINSRVNIKVALDAI